MDVHKVTKREKNLLQLFRGFYYKMFDQLGMPAPEQLQVLLKGKLDGLKAALADLESPIYDYCATPMCLANLNLTGILIASQFIQSKPSLEQLLILMDFRGQTHPFSEDELFQIRQEGFDCRMSPLLHEIWLFSYSTISKVAEQIYQNQGSKAEITETQVQQLKYIPRAMAAYPLTFITFPLTDQVREESDLRKLDTPLDLSPLDAAGGVASSTKVTETLDAFLQDVPNKLILVQNVLNDSSKKEKILEQVQHVMNDKAFLEAFEMEGLQDELVDTHPNAGLPGYVQDSSELVRKITSFMQTRLGSFMSDLEEQRKSSGRMQEAIARRNGGAKGNNPGATTQGEVRLPFQQRIEKMAAAIKSNPHVEPLLVAIGDAIGQDTRPILKKLDLINKSKKRVIIR